MSTKIYNGLKFTSTDFAELFGQLQRFRKRLVGLTQSEAGSYMAARVVRMIDDAAANEMPLENFLSKASREFREEVDEIKKTGYRNPSVDFEFKVMIFPHKGEFYGTVFTEQSDWMKLLRSQKWVREYSYHDSTDDTPPGVSYEDYRKRGDVWSEILGPDMIPVNHGVEANLTYLFHWIEWEWVEEELAKQTFDARLQEVAEQRTSNAHMAKIMADKEQPADGRMDEYMGAFWEARKWLKTDEGKAAIAVEAERCRPLLVPVLTKEVLNGSASK